MCLKSLLRSQYVELNERALEDVSPWLAAAKTLLHVQEFDLVKFGMGVQTSHLLY